MQNLGKLKLNTSYKAHFFLALILGIWLVLFLVFVGPFDVAPLPLKIRFILLPPYGLIFIASYLALLPFQNWIFRKLAYWNLFLELLFIGIFYLLCLFSSFRYYQSEVVNGDYSFSQYVGQIYFPTLLILTGILLFARWFIARETKVVFKQTDKLVLRGNNKSDLLQLDFADLICISSAQNYVEVFYLQNNELDKHLLRTTLKQISQEVPDLVRVHRSHFINPAFFVRWLDQNTIRVYDLEIPVSQNYKKVLDQHV